MIVKKGILSSGALAVQPGAGGGFDENGLYFWRETRRCDIAFAAQYTPDFNSPHPRFPGLVLKALSTRELPLGIYEYEGTWRGLVAQTGAGGQIVLPPPIESVISSAGEEDIRTNPDFQQFAGTPDNPLNGAVYDEETGFFLGFGPDAPPSLRGVEGYLTPSVIFQRISYSFTIPSNGQSVGKFNQPGGAYANAQTSGAENWLKITGDSEQFGQIYQLRDAWLRSGPLGWSVDIYP